MSTKKRLICLPTFFALFVLVALATGKPFQKPSKSTEFADDDDDDNEEYSSVDSPEIAKNFNSIAKNCDTDVHFKNEWQTILKDFDYHCWNDEQMQSYVAEKWQQKNEWFLSLDIIQQTDVFRLMIIHDKGGCYADTDTEPYPGFAYGFDRHKHSQIIVGYEANFLPGQQETPGRGWTEMLPKSLAQWVFCGQKGNQVLLNLIDVIEAKTKDPALNRENHREYRDYITKTTGPVVFSQEILKAHEDPGNDILVLPINANGCGQDHSGSSQCNHNDVRQWSKHHFHNSWVPHR
eukprot:m.22311 g.22311  ORF g.22311 m.22311 type:complete len:292 (+) comp7386_c0_seq1:171-1046(+)